MVDAGLAFAEDAAPAVVAPVAAPVVAPAPVVPAETEATVTMTGVSNVQYSWYKIFSATGSNAQLINGDGVVIESPNGGYSQITSEFLPGVGSLDFQLLKSVVTNMKTARIRVNIITRNAATNQLINYYGYSPTATTNKFRIHEKGLVLRSSSSSSRVEIVNVPGGVGDFMVLFRNGSDSAGARKIALDVSGRHYESAAVDSSEPVLFRVDGINNADNENTYNTIAITNAAANLVTIDSIVWTAYKDPLQIVSATQVLAVAEGATSSVAITLSQYPDYAVTVSVQRVGGSTNVTTEAAPFVLDQNNWNSGQSVAFFSGEDTDVLNDSADFLFAASGALSVTVTVTQTDNDVGPEVSTTNLLVREGATNSLQLRLTKAPMAETTVTVSRISGDADLDVAGSAVFLFTTVNWSNWQAALITAVPDVDTLDGSAVFQVASAGVDPVSVAATERDAAWTNWVAFHDLHPTNNGDAASTTLGFTHGAAFGLTNALTTQRIDGVSLTLRYFDKNGVEKPTSAVLDNSALANPANGTHAATLFTNYVKPNAVYTLQSTTDYAVVNNASWGSVSPTGGVYTSGTVVQITATASNGFSFVNWSGDASGTGNPEQLSMNGPKSVIALFDELLYTNGTPASWLAQYGLDLSDAGALSDTDGDGLVAWQEYIAGTLPNLGTSVFEISNHWKTPDGTGYAFAWPTVSGRIYSVYWSSNLVSGVWSQMSGSANGVYTDAVHGAETEGFYRVKVRMNP